MKRVRIFKNENTRIEIKAKSDFLLAFVLLLITTLWTIIGLIAVKYAVPLGQGIWLIFWGIAEAILLYISLWTILGKEVLIITEENLYYKRMVLNFAYINESYSLNRINYMQYEGIHFKPLSWEASMVYWGVSGKTIGFQYETKTIEFGIQLNREEAMEVINEINICKSI